MKTSLIIAGAALAMAASPASAQLLGGLGGSIGGTAGGVVNGSLGRVTTTNTTILRGEGRARANKKVNTRSGRADADAGLAGAAQGTLGTATGSPFGSADASGSAGAHGSHDGAVGVQAIGTDSLANTLSGTAGSAANAAGSLSGLAGGLTGGGSASGSGNGSGSLGGGPLAATGSAVAAAAGVLTVSPGMAVEDARGRAIGAVEGLRARANGLVDVVIVQVRDQQVALPADNFTVAGEALVSAMSRAEVRKEAERQARTEGDGQPHSGGPRDVPRD